jgi:hypothetical protein
MKDHHNKQWRAKSFDIDEWVWLRLQHCVAARIAPLKFSKLYPRYFGPYKIIVKIGEVAYRLQLPEKAHIHNVFHVALLKKFQGTPPVSIVPLPPLQHGHVLATPAKVMKARLNRGTWEVLVSWLDKPPTESTWEKFDVFKKTYWDMHSSARSISIERINHDSLLEIELVTKIEIVESSCVKKGL